MPQLTGELAYLGYVRRASEFFSEGGTLLTGTCGPDALASAASYSNQTFVTTQSVFDAMRAAGRCDANGDSNESQLAAQARDMKLPVIEERGYGEPWTNYDSFFGWHLQPSQAHVCITEVANGQALVDSISGQGENANHLQYHWLLFIARHGGGYSAYAGRDLPAGYWTCDGDNYAGRNDRADGFNAADVLQFYSDDVVLAARPCAAIAIARLVVQPPQGGTGGGSTSMTTGVPNGWHDDGKTLTAPNGVVVVNGFRIRVLAGWDPQNLPLAPEEGSDPAEFGHPEHGAGTHQYFYRSVLVWTQSTNVYEADAGTLAWRSASEASALGQQLSAAQAAASQAVGLQQQLAAAQQQVKADSGIIGGLQQQVAQLTQQLQQAGTPSSSSGQPMTQAQFAQLVATIAAVVAAALHVAVLNSSQQGSSAAPAA